MRWRQLLLFLLCSCIALPTWAAQRDWPRLVSTAYHPECMASLSMADAEFRATKPDLVSPEPDKFDFAPSLLIVERSGLDLSSGDALRVAPGVFDRLEGKGRYRGFLWQIEPFGGQRLVIEEERFGWRGDAYNFRLVDANIPAHAYVDERRDERPDAHRDLISRAWNPPLVFRDADSGRVWFIHFEPSISAFGRWMVYLPGTDGYQPVCQIEFTPRAARSEALLPPSLRKLGAQLDAIMGDGRDEGTAQPTGHLKWRAQFALLNAIFRPWVTAGAYNSRAEVDAAMLTWAAASKTNQGRYQRIQTQYRLSEMELARRYQSDFGMSATVAQTSAAEVLDAVFRAHFVFAKSR